jgi:hypothetical protein
MGGFSKGMDSGRCRGVTLARMSASVRHTSSLSPLDRGLGSQAIRFFWRGKLPLLCLYSCKGNTRSISMDASQECGPECKLLCDANYIRMQRADFMRRSDIAKDTCILVPISASYGSSPVPVCFEVYISFFALY